jgi:hypothetical protein
VGGGGGGVIPPPGAEIEVSGRWRRGRRGRPSSWR